LFGGIIQIIFRIDELSFIFMCLLDETQVFPPDFPIGKWAYFRFAEILCGKTAHFGVSRNRVLLSSFEPMEEGWSKKGQ